MNTQLPQHLIDKLPFMFDGTHKDGYDILLKSENSAIILKLAKQGDTCALYLAAIISLIKNKDKESKKYLIQCVMQDESFEAGVVLALVVIATSGDKTFRFTTQIMQTLENGKYSAAHLFLGYACEYGFGGVEINVKRAMYEYEQAFKIARGVTSLVDSLIYDDLLGKERLMAKLLPYYSSASKGTEDYSKVIELSTLDLKQGSYIKEVTLMWLANAYRWVGQYKKALECHLKIGETNYSGYCSIANMYLKDLVPLDNSIVEKYLRKAINMVKENGNDEEELAECKDWLNKVLARRVEESELGKPHEVLPEQPEVFDKSVAENNTPPAPIVYAQCETVQASNGAQATHVKHENGAAYTKFSVWQIVGIIVAVAAIGVTIATTICNILYVNLISSYIGGAILGVILGCEVKYHGNSRNFKILAWAISLPLVLINLGGQLIAIMVFHTSDAIFAYLSCAIPAAAVIGHSVLFCILRKRFDHIPSVLMSYMALVIYVGYGIYMFIREILKLFGVFVGETIDSENKRRADFEARKINYADGYYVVGNELYDRSNNIIGKKDIREDTRYLDRDGNIIGEVDKVNNSIRIRK